MMIRKCNVAGKPIIVATQMLESMVKSPVPTRAEVSDVYNAIEDGADCVMLSAETAAGDYPDLAVAMMERIIRLSESLMPKRDPDDYDSDLETTSEILGHLVFNACKEFDDIHYEKGKIVCLTSSGNSARMISKYRPSRPILAITSSPKTAKELRIVGGVEPVCIPELAKCKTTMEKMKKAVKFCIGSKLVDESENLVITGNVFDRRGQTNSLSILKAGEIRDL
jgi:pyruvate kinase